MRELSVEKITDAIREMFISINYELPPEIGEALREAREAETSPVAENVLAQLEENLRVAKAEQIPICQDTGMAVVFLEIGQEVHLTGGDLEAAVNEGVRRAYDEGYLRKSVVGDPITRENTGDNTPAVIHTRIVPGEGVRVRVTAKGFGSENTSRLVMLKPAQGVDGIKQVVLDAVREAGPNACPPIVVGVGIGGNFEKAALMAKEALLGNSDAGCNGDGGCNGDVDFATRLRGCKVYVPIAPSVPIASLETDLLREINALGIGPAGLGGRTTALAVHIKTYPTHIAGLPVAVNICCHADRFAEKVL